MIITTPLSLLYIEPKQIKKYNEALAEKYEWVKQALLNCMPGAYIDESNRFEKNVTYWGKHQCSCGEWSTCFDILLPNHMITNSLAYHYICYHSAEIPEIEWFKLDQLKAYLELQIN